MSTVNIPVRVNETLPDGDYILKTTISVKGDVITPSNYSLTEKSIFSFLDYAIGVSLILIFSMVFLDFMLLRVKRK